MTTNNFKPILFSTEMVQAILAGRKTQTRRVCKISPEANIMGFYVKRRLWDSSIEENPNPIGHIAKFNWGEVKSKYTEGDIIWVRETFQKLESVKHKEIDFLYKADVEYHNYFNSDLVVWSPSIFMPKEAARIFLKVTNVRVERLQDISEEDAIAEGIAVSSKVGSDGHYYYKDYNDTTDWPEVGWMHASTSFQTLWDSINEKKHPWNSNPWVWVYEFERIEKPQNFN